MHQETSLARLVDTCWGSHYKIYIRILSMWHLVFGALGDISNDGICKKQRGTVMGLVQKMEKYEFVFTGHLMIELLRLTSELLCFYNKNIKR